MRLIIGITGASGCLYARKLLEVLQEKKVETILIMSENAKKTISLEDGTPEEYMAMATQTYYESDLSSPVSSGSFKTDGMIIIPCSMKTLSAIASGYSGNCLTRAADVTIKEGRRLVLVPRETPLNAMHLENMLKLARLGVTILPAMPAFYSKPKKIDDLASFIVGRVLDIFGIEHELYKRWGETVA